MQPLDVGIFKPIRSAYAKESDKFTKKYGLSAIKLSTFAHVILPSFKAGVTRHNCKAAFRKCGLFPYNMDAIDYEKLVTREKQAEEPDITIGVEMESKLYIYIYIYIYIYNMLCV